MYHQLYLKHNMNKKYYVAPQAETVSLYVESAILDASPEGFKKQLTEDEGDEELTRRKDGFGSTPWADAE